MKYNKGFAPVIILIIVLGVLAVGGVAYYTTKTPNLSPQNTDLNNYSEINNNKQESDNQKKPDYIIALNQQDQKLILVDINSKLVKPITGSFMSYSSTNYVHTYDFSFSPDKKSFLVIKDNNIFKIDTDTLTEKQLTFQGTPETKEFFGIQVSHPKWGPDGQHIYFGINKIYSDNESQKKLPKTQLGTWIMDQNGNQQKYLSKINYPSGNPVGWMANGKEIVFNDNFSAKLYNIETEETRNFSNQKVQNISFSKNGKFGVYSIEDSMDNYLIDSNFNIIDSIIRQKGQTPANPLTTNYLLEFWEARSISPDGKYVLITKLTQPYEKGQQLDTYIDDVELYLWNTLTKEKIKLPILLSQLSKVFWSPDNNKIIFTRPEKLKLGNPTVRLMDIYTYDIKNQKEDRITSSNNLDHTFIDY